MLELLRKRRSIRKYQDREVEREKIDAIIKAGLLSPSSRGICPWEFIIVTEGKALERLSKCREVGSDFLKDAPLGIIVLADGSKTDVWVEDASIASIIMQLKAQSLGLGSCWIQVRNRMHSEDKTTDEYIKEQLSIPDHMCIESILSIGYPDEVKSPYDMDELKYDKVFMHRYGNKY